MRKAAQQIAQTRRARLRRMVRCEDLEQGAAHLDGTKIATAEGRDGARVWDAAVRGKPTKSSWLGVDEIYVLDTPLQVLQAPSAEISQKLAVTWAEFSPDGKRLITIHSYGPVKVTDTSSWALEEEIHLTDITVQAAAFGPTARPS